MSGVLKTIGTIATVVAGVALVATGVGAALGGTMMLTAFGGAGIAASTIAAIAGGVAAAASLGTSLLGGAHAPQTSTAAADRLQLSVDTKTPRKICFGTTAQATDIRDQEFTNNQELLHRFVVRASHKTGGVREIWFDDKLAWNSRSGIQGDFLGYLGVENYDEGSAANAKNISPRMGSSRRFTGLAWTYLRYKLTGNSKNADSPFASSVPTRVTIVGDGALIYDPRLDSTVPGGSGPMRADDQTTWAWDDEASRNPALQLLWYLLGWRIQNPVTGDWKLAVGKGIPAARIDLASFITAANLCDEPVTLAAGGTQPRYRSDGVFSEGDGTSTVLDQLKSAMNAELDDVDGKIRITVLHNDLATPVADLTTDDVIGAFKWSQTAPLTQSYNVIRGTFIDPSTRSLFQAVDYPEVRIDSPDGIDRVQTVDFQTVQDGSQAQRLVKQRIARQLYSGTFAATFSHRAWKVQKNDVIRFTFSPLGWTNKLFRVVEADVQVNGQVNLLLQVEHPDIYLWDADERPSIQAVEPTSYDPYLNPIMRDVLEPSYSDGTPIDNLRPAAPGATNGADPNSPLGNGGMTVGEFLQLQTQAHADIARLQQDAGDLETAATQLDARIHAAEGTITRHTEQIGEPGADVRTIWQAIDSVEGQLANLDISVRAGSNLLTNGGLETGDFTGWGSGYGGWNVDPDGWGGWGPVSYINNPPVSAADQYFFQFTEYSCGAMVAGAFVGQPVTFTCDSLMYVQAGGVGRYYAQLDWVDAGGNVIGRDFTAGSAQKPASFDFDPEDQKRRDTKVTGLVRAGAVKVNCLIVFYVAANTVATSLAWRRAKLERGTEATPFTAESTVHQSFKAIFSTQTQVAQLLSQVGVPGADARTRGRRSTTATPRSRRSSRRSASPARTRARSGRPSMPVTLRWPRSSRRSGHPAPTRVPSGRPCTRATRTMRRSRRGYRRKGRTCASMAASRTGWRDGRCSAAISAPATSMGPAPSSTAST